MSKAGRKRKAGQRKAPSMVDRFVRPTEAREAHNDFRSAGPAVRAIPPIETLYEAGKLSAKQFEALARYSDIAHAANRSEVKSNIDFSIYGSGEGLPHFGVRMNLELATLDKALEHDNLRQTARAICVREISLSRWAMERSGSVMRERRAKGQKIIRWYEPKRIALMIAKVELEAAADKLAKAMRLA